MNPQLKRLIRRTICTGCVRSEDSEEFRDSLDGRPPGHLTMTQLMRFLVTPPSQAHVWDTQGGQNSGSMDELIAPLLDDPDPIAVDSLA